LLDLLIPGLLPDAAPAARMPHLERWLARADITREPGAGAEAWLAGRYGLDPAPVAAVSLAVDEAPQPGQWLRADPVYARIERDTLVLHHAAMLAIEPEEARALVAALRELFGADGLEFHAPRPDRWYVRVPAGELPRTTPLGEALGRDVFGRLPRGEGRINWAAALTEAQMMLATHPVNLAREAARRPPVNAVWFWGGGSLPRDVAPAYARVFATDPFAAGLAHLSGAVLAPPPASLRELEVAPSTLVVIDVAAAALDAGDAAGWRSAVESLDERWFAGLGSYLAHGTVRLVMPARTDACVATLTPRARWRLFRGSKPLAAHA
jgi:hypothetical protein